MAKCMRRYALWLRTTLSAEGATSGVGVQQQSGLPEPLPPASPGVQQPESSPVSVNQPVSRKRSQAEDEDDIDVSRLFEDYPNVEVPLATNPSVATSPIPQGPSPSELPAPTSVSPSDPSGQKPDMPVGAGRSLLKRPFPRSPMPGEMASEASRGQKRVADSEVVDLEQEIQASAGPAPMPLESMFWAYDTAISVVGSMDLLTAPEIVDMSVCSVKFDELKGGSKKMWLGNAHVLVWAPSSGVDDTTLEELPGSLVFAGMQEEISNLQKCKTGRVIDASELARLQEKHTGLRLISSRWVCARKSAEKVRSRIVAKDIASGSARKQGFSSPTPSHDAFMVSVSLLALGNMRCCAADISHAFMHSPLTSAVPIVLKLPLSVSLMDGQAAYLLLYCALNGLRDASQAWLALLGSLIRPLGLEADHREPCLFSGRIAYTGSETSQASGRAIVLVYVDDILIITDDEEIEKKILDAIGKRVTVKVTGQLLPDREGGGQVHFIGRTLRRWTGRRDVEVFVKAGYLDSCFVAYKLERGSGNVPNIATTLEHSATSPSLTPEAYSKFRKVLGKLLWYAQTRQDIKFLVGLLSTQQAQPTQAAETALRALLRFLVEDKSVVLRLLSQGLDPDFLGCNRDDMLCRLHVYADASHAPYRCLGRKGVSGGALCYGGCLIRSMAKVQGVVSMSSCEAELHALQFMCQESVGLVFLLTRVLSSLEGWTVSIDSEAHVMSGDEGESERSDQAWLWTELCTDSQSAIDLLANQDLPRRSRHVEIRIAWLRHQMSSGRVHLKWLSGVSNPADMFTKCLSTSVFNQHRSRLGFVSMRDEPAEELFSLSCRSGGILTTMWTHVSMPLALLEVCCEKGSALSVECKLRGIPYAGITGDMQEKRIIKQARDIVDSWKQRKLWVHVHLSTPCSSGSPLKHFRRQSEGQMPSVSDVEWQSIMESALVYANMGNAASFELPRFNQIWERFGTQRLLEKAALLHTAHVWLCRTGVKGKTGLPVGKQLRFQSTAEAFAIHMHVKFGTCTCTKHSSFSQTDWSDTANYNQVLAREMIRAMQRE